jgi:hypothetical protein
VVVVVYNAIYIFDGFMLSGEESLEDQNVWCRLVLHPNFDVDFNTDL